MTYYGNKLTLSLVLLLTTCTPFAAPLVVRARTVAVAKVGFLAEANAASRALLLKIMMLLTMIAVIVAFCVPGRQIYVLVWGLCLEVAV